MKIWKYLADQGGQFWGSYWKNFANQYLNETSPDTALRRKLIEAQIGNYESLAKDRDLVIQEKQRQRTALDDAVKAIETGVQEPIMEQPYGPPEESGKLPEPIQTGVQKRALNPQEMVPHLLKIDPDSARVLMRQAVPGGGGGQAVGTSSDMVKRFIANNPNASLDDIVNYREGILARENYHRQTGGTQGRISEELYGPGQHSYVPPPRPPVAQTAPQQQPQGVRPPSGAQVPLIAPQLAPGAQPLPPTQGPTAPPPKSTLAPQRGESPAMQLHRDKARAGKQEGNRADAEEALVALADASGLIDELDELSKDLFTHKKDASYLDRGIGAATQYAQSWDPGSSIAIYESRKQTVGENLARGIGGVKGTATEGDIKRMLVALPKIGDTEESRAYKIAAFREIIGKAIRNKQRFIAGEPIDLTQSKREFSGLVDQFVRGKYVPGQPSGQQQVPTSATRGRFNPQTGKIEF